MVWLIPFSVFQYRPRCLAGWRLTPTTPSGHTPSALPRPRHGDSHPSGMLQYLDNAQKRQAISMRTTARELMELHTPAGLRLYPTGYQEAGANTDRGRRERLGQ